MYRNPVRISVRFKDSELYLFSISLLFLSLFSNYFLSWNLRLEFNITLHDSVSHICHSYNVT